MTQEQLVIVECIPVVRTSRNSQFFFKGPRIWNCLPASVTNLSSFSIFKNKVLEFFFKIVTELVKPQFFEALISYNILMSKWPLLYVWWFLEVSSPNNLLYSLKFAVTQRLINDDDGRICSISFPDLVWGKNIFPQTSGETFFS